ncbi:MAG: hypothetical protein ALAOOOJD_01859 [bacterium]|nr:hypothetical protein [bacterium]
MKNFRLAVLGILLVGLLGLAFSPLPDFKTTTVTQMKFTGMLGTMMKMFGGNKPITSTQYIQGHKSRSDNLDEKGNLTSSAIIDLDREVMINIDHKKKEYTETTFAEFLQRLNEMKEKTKPQPTAEKEQPEVKMSFDVKVDRTGEKKTIAGYSTEKVILTMTATGEGTDAESGETGKGGMMVTSTHWMASSVKGYEEVQAFQMAFAQKLGEKAGANSMAQLLENLKKTNPQLAEAMKKLEQEGKKLQGVSLVTTTVFETWAEGAADQAPQAEKAEESNAPKSVGGLLGGLGKKLGQKAAKKDESASNNGRAVLLESTSEITAIGSSAVEAGLFTAPVGYKKKETK